MVEISWSGYSVLICTVSSFRKDQCEHSCHGVLERILSVLLCSALDKLILVVLKVILHFYYDVHHVGGNGTLKAYSLAHFLWLFCLILSSYQINSWKNRYKKCNQEKESKNLFLMVYKLVLLKCKDQYYLRNSFIFTVQ